MSEHAPIPGSRKRPPPRLADGEAVLDIRERLAREWAQFITFPEGPFTVTDYGSGIVGEQSVVVDPEEMEAMVHEAEQHKASEKHPAAYLEQIARMVIGKFPGNVAKWHEEFESVGRDEHTTLQAVRDAEAATCFHRSVALGYVLSRIGIKAKIISGVVIGSKRTDIFKNTPGVHLRRGGYGVLLENDEHMEGHMAVAAQINDAYYLLDAAMTIEDDIAKADNPGVANVPVVAAIDVPRILATSVGPNQDIAIPLPDGRFQHYVFQGRSVNISADNKAETNAPA